MSGRAPTVIPAGYYTLTLNGPASMTGMALSVPCTPAGALHESVKSAALELRAGTWEEKIPIFYGDAVDAYPTSPDDVIGWLRDHYQEHVPHTGELLAEWRASRVAK